MSVKVVSGLTEAIDHINKYGTKHSEAIVTADYNAARRFLHEVDAAAVYVNASTRFTDGGEFGFGAEIGISTQKLHARGPMGLPEMTSTKYVVTGDGRVVTCSPEVNDDLFWGVVAGLGQFGERMGADRGEGVVDQPNAGDEAGRGSVRRRHSQAVAAEDLAPVMGEPGAFPAEGISSSRIHGGWNGG